MRRDEPPPAVDSEEELAVLAEGVRPARRSLQVIDVRLIVSQGLALLGDKLVREDGEEDALDEGKYAAQEAAAVVLRAHVGLAVLRRKEHVEGHSDQQAEVDAAEEAEEDELHKVFDACVRSAV